MRSFTTRTAGLVILIGGIWGGLIPFVGPYFHFAVGPDKSWTWTSGRLYLNILPGVVAVLGGLLLLRAGPRPTGRLGALLALVAGIWFVIGPPISVLWQIGGAQGAPRGSRGVQVLELLTYYYGLGALLTALAAYALPGFLRERAVVAAAATGGAVAGRETAPDRESAPDRETADAHR